MFNPGLAEVREFFFTTYQKGLSQQNLTPLEEMAYSIIIEHSEYRYILDNPVKYKEKEWPIDGGETNPFLHLSLHLSLLEQLSIDQPLGIRKYYQALTQKYLDPHEASHAVLECLTTMIWRSKENNLPLDLAVYFKCLDEKCKK